MSETIEGKVVVITGASSGPGEATARMLADMKEDNAAAVAKVMEDAGYEVSAAPVYSFSREAVLEMLAGTAIPLP